MIKSLTDAHVADALPRIVANQDWVSALSEAVNLMHRRTMRYIDESQIYTDIGNASEEVLDALAVNWKVDWYDTGYAVEQKRRIIQTALTVRRLMGTVSAVKLQIDAIFPETELEEWFDYGGDPGTFRLYLNVTETTPSNPAKIYSAKEIERRLITAKRWSAHLESMSYMIKRGVSIGSKVEIWAIRPPLCGTIYCGTYWMPSTLGRTERHAIATMPRAEAFNAQPDFAGTLPVPATVGYSACGAMACAGAPGAYIVSPEFSGTLPGNKDEMQNPDFIYQGTKGYSVDAEILSGQELAADGIFVEPPLSGQGRCGTLP